jgi:hypothetical protein
MKTALAGLILALIPLVIAAVTACVIAAVVAWIQGAAGRRSKNNIPQSAQEDVRGMSTAEIFKRIKLLRAELDSRTARNGTESFRAGERRESA